MVSPQFHKLIKAGSIPAPAISKKGIIAKMSEKKVLYLHLKYVYFDQIKAGTKTVEYRLAEKYQHKLDRNDYTHIRLYRGYDKATPETVMDFPYNGYKLETITHPHFDNVPTLVCALPLI